MTSGIAGPAAVHVRSLCPLNHELPAVLIRIDESRDVTCAKCAAVVQLMPFIRDGAVRVGWATLKHPQDQQVVYVSLASRIEALMADGIVRDAGAVATELGESKHACSVRMSYLADRDRLTRVGIGVYLLVRTEARP